MDEIYEGLYIFHYIYGKSKVIGVEFPNTVLLRPENSYGLIWAEREEISIDNNFPDLTKHATANNYHQKPNAV